MIALAGIALPASAVLAQNSAVYGHNRLLIRDEGLSQLALIDFKHPAYNWYTPVTEGRDMQLVGNNLVLAGTNDGYIELDLETGQQRFALAGHPGTIAARRLRNGHTLLTGLNWQGKKGIVLMELDASDSIIRTINYPGFNYVRLVRETVPGRFLITADDTVFEGDSSGTVIWQAKIAGVPAPHAWQALRLANGQTMVSCGYAKNLQLFSAGGKLLDSITGPGFAMPHFYAGFQVLANGNYLVANWEGHGKASGGTGIQVLEYNPQGKLAWSWKQDPSRFSSLHSVIVLDGLDLNLLHIEDRNGILAPVPRSFVK